MKLAILSVLAGYAAAFAPAPQSTQSSVALHETKADLNALAQKLNPVVGMYDPLNLAEAEFWGYSNEATIGFLRHAEIKHSRVAMFAFVGYIAHANGIKFPWAMQMDGSPFPTETSPPQLWDAVSDSAKFQIFAVILFLEAWSEIPSDSHQHYMAGGKPGAYPDFTTGEDGIPHPVPFNFYDPFKLSSKRSAEAKERGLVVEINNGRLAMIGIMGFVAANSVEGSVPLLSGVVQHYDGQVMAPFVTNYLGQAWGLQ